ncbi:alpha/beta fold hydrolase [Pseudogracilibacillus auburnensis]|uniref:Pimeloyl-ACP methyl ester carboxylesterase n=1 Tax=Pseudogracilibacillus auburnensis TaxID=1494959 RepID=A0A2V3W4B5_9BACI|nr:alpha/beta hydrolase [Pseudogracilibacillus auburnensis]PXW87911.1 pimeloyl-ACP methyl ester carboxylesterase [Pseudogracilibacillus auburnensis]
MKRIKKVAIVSVSFLLLLCTLLIIIGTLYEKYTLKNIVQDYPPSGERFDIGGRFLHANIQGEKSDKTPTVVIEAGTGSWSEDWQIVQKQLAKDTQIVTYDRAGYGWSDPSSEPLSSEQLTSDLHTLLGEAGVDTPIILVAHSSGGIYSRMYMERYPKDVIGLILVDARHEGFSKQYPEYTEAMLETETQGSNSFLARIGALRLLNNIFAPDHLPEQFDIDVYMNVLWDRHFFDIITEEVNNMGNFERELSPLPEDIRITVITPDTHHMNAVELGFSEEDEHLLQQGWHDHQLSFPADRHVIAENSSHSVMFDRPELIVEETLHMIETIKKEKTR